MIYFQGIPSTAFENILSKLPARPHADSLREAMGEIQLIIASRLSSNL